MGERERKQEQLKQQRDRKRGMDRERDPYDYVILLPHRFTFKAGDTDVPEKSNYYYYSFHSEQQDMVTTVCRLQLNRGCRL